MSNVGDPPSWRAEIENLVDEGKLRAIATYVDDVNTRRQRAAMYQISLLLFALVVVAMLVFLNELTSSDRGALFNGVVAISLAVWTSMKGELPAADTGAIDALAGTKLTSNTHRLIREQAHKVSAPPDRWIPLIAAGGVFAVLILNFLVPSG